MRMAEFSKSYTVTFDLKFDQEPIEKQFDAVGFASPFYQAVCIARYAFTSP
jgi:hypothetical protein